MGGSRGSLPRRNLREPEGALQIPPLRSFGAPVGMTRGGQLLFGRVATWMGAEVSLKR
jgi:hypothetical protein